jgi:Mg2+ and Co2+ transporter CorA
MQTQSEQQTEIDQLRKELVRVKNALGDLMLLLERFTTDAKVVMIQLDNIYRELYK